MPNPVGPRLIASAWLLALTLLNHNSGGTFRGALLYAVPVVITASQSWSEGLLFAGLGTLSAWLGGSLPSPHAVDPFWVEGLWAFTRLSIVAGCVRAITVGIARR